MGNDIVFYGLLVAQFSAVITISTFITRIPDNLAEITFGLYCFLTGLALSIIFLAFSISSIAYVTLITAAMFGFMSLSGYVTKTDLTSVGSILTMCLFGVIPALVVNLFTMNSVLDTIPSILGVIIFSGFAAHDTQNVKRMQMDHDQDIIRIEIPCALNLYLDFANLFLDPIDLLGKRRSD